MPRGDLRKHRHHYLPVFHLKRFSDSSGCVWVHDRDGAFEPNPKLLKPAAIAAVDELYTLEEETGERSDELETWLADEIDGPSAAIFPKLISGAQLNGWERSRIANYVMSRDLRTPKARSFLLEVTRHQLGAVWDKEMADTQTIRDRILADGGPSFSDEEIAYYSSIYRPQVTDGFWHDFMIRHITGGSPRIFAKGWKIVSAPADASFITTDVGILKHRDSFQTPSPHMIGWWNNAEAWIMPLAPQTALFMAPGLIEGYANATPEYVRTINAALKQQADRFTFGSSREAVVEA